MFDLSKPVGFGVVAGSIVLIVLISFLAYGVLRYYKKARD